MTWWIPWAFWIVVVALATTSAVEPVKRRLKGDPSWARLSWAAKVQTLTPWLAGIGAIIGIVVYPAVGLVEKRVAALVLGAATGALSFALRDAVVGTIGLLPAVAKARFVRGEGEGDREGPGGEGDQEGRATVETPAISDPSDPK